MELNTDKPVKPVKKRHYSRLFACQGMYAWMIAPDNMEAIASFIAEKNEFDLADQDYFYTLLAGGIEQHDVLLEKLQPHLDRPHAQLDPIEKAILVIACYEMSQAKTPIAVVINEAIEIAKKIACDGSHRYVHRALDQLHKS